MATSESPATRVATILRLQGQAVGNSSPKIDHSVPSIALRGFGGKWDRRLSRQDLSFLNLHNINGLQALRALNDLEIHGVPFFQRPISLSHNPGVVDEDIWSIFAADEPVTLRVVEPFYYCAQLTFPLRFGRIQDDSLFP